MARQAVSLEINTVCPRKGGRVYRYWVLRWLDPRTGKRLGETIGRADDRHHDDFLTKTAARALQRAKQSELAARPGRRSRAMTLGELIARWAGLRATQQLSPKTLAIDEYAGRALMAHFGEGHRVDRISRADASEWWASFCGGKLDEKVSKTGKACQLQRRSTYLRAIKPMFDWAYDELEVVSKDPFKKIKRPAPVADTDWRYVDATTFWPLWRVATPAWKRALMLARFAALSSEDIRELTWDKVELGRREIRIKRAKTGIDQHAPIDPTLREQMEQWTVERDTLKFGADPVVAGLYVGNAGRDIRAMCRRAGVEPYGKPLHTLRKSCILDWARIQPSAQVLQRWAGHSSITTTQTFYDRVRDQDMNAGKVLPLLSRPDLTPGLFESPTTLPTTGGSRA